MIKPHLKAVLWLSILLCISCSVQLPAQPPPDIVKLFPSIVTQTRTPFLPVKKTPIPAVPSLTPTFTLAPTQTLKPVPQPILFLDPSLPQGLVAQLHLPDGVVTTTRQEQSNLLLGAIRGGPPLVSDWVYALAAPFPTLTDDVPLADILKAWKGEPTYSFAGKPLLMAASTRAAFSALWGPPSGDRVQVMADESLLDTAWSMRPSWALVPFENLNPRWKVLSIDGASPIYKEFDPKSYPLVVRFGVSGDEEILNNLKTRLGNAASFLPVSNRDPGKLTTLVMTGTTALVRAIAAKMDANGVTYPARDIYSWLYDADLLHISNEVSFNKACPPGDPNYDSLMFCSRPEYIGLLDYIGTDIVELSGNHNNDWGRDAFTYSLELYKERGWLVYAGGANLDEARAPRMIENHGNRFAFIGCNPAGPDTAWATKDEAGVASCDYDWMANTVTQLKQQGYIVIVTFQYFEHYVYPPTPQKQIDFRRMADAGAVIVSGSQSHYPQTMELYKDSYIHYGLGNLFFDQMDIPVVGTRREFIDRHVFYDGKLISTELLTAMLEDYSRPRPMTPEERQSLLSDIFNAAGW